MNGPFAFVQLNWPTFWNISKAIDQKVFLYQLVYCTYGRGALKMLKKGFVLRKEKFRLMCQPDFVNILKKICKHLEI